MTCEAKDNTFNLNEPVKVRVQVADRVKKVKTLRLMSEVISFQGREVFHAKQNKVFSGTCDVSLEYKIASQGPYFVTVYLYDNSSGVLLVAKRIIVG